MYQIQAKAPGMKRFMLLDVNEGVCVRLAFHATMFTSKEEALDCISKIQELNPKVELRLKKC